MTTEVTMDIDSTLFPIGWQIARTAASEDEFPRALHRSVLVEYHVMRGVRLVATNTNVLASVWVPCQSHWAGNFAPPNGDEPQHRWIVQDRENQVKNLMTLMIKRCRDLAKNDEDPELPSFQLRVQEAPARTGQLDFGDGWYETDMVFDLNRGEATVALPVVDLPPYNWPGLLSPAKDGVASRIEHNWSEWTLDKLAKISKLSPGRLRIKQPLGDRRDARFFSSADSGLQVEGLVILQPVAQEGDGEAQEIGYDDVFAEMVSVWGDEQLEATRAQQEADGVSFSSVDDESPETIAMDLDGPVPGTDPGFDPGEEISLDELADRVTGDDDGPSLADKLANIHPEEEDDDELDLSEPDDDTTPAVLDSIDQVLADTADLTDGADGWDLSLKEAAELVVSTDLGSSAMLMRTFNLGFTRAARLIDQLEKIGVLGGPEQDNVPRKVLVDPGSLTDEVFDDVTWARMLKAAE